MTLDEVICVSKDREKGRTESWGPSMLDIRKMKRNQKIYGEGGAGEIKGNHKRVEAQRPGEIVFTNHEPLCCC